MKQTKTNKENMKKMLLAAVSVMMLCVGCGSKNSPAGVVEECWKRLSEGKVREAVELMDVEESERAIYCQMFEEQSGELVEVGGIEDFEVLSLSEGENDATIEAIVTLRDGQHIGATYKLVRRNKHWLITE